MVRSQKTVSKDVPDGYDLQYRYWDDNTNKVVEVFYNPTEKIASKAYIKKEYVV